MTPDLLPSAVESERFVLGSMLQSPDAAELACRELSESDFYEPRHQMIFRTLGELTAERFVFDAHTVSRALEDRRTLDKIGGLPCLLDLMEVAITPINVDFHVTAVRNCAVRRDISCAARDLLRLVADPEVQARELLDTASRFVSDIELRRGFSDGLRTLNDILNNEVSDELRLAEQRAGLVGLTTGYNRLDALTLGWRDGDFVIVAGRPSVGKTALGLALLLKAVQGNGVPAAMFSLEMGVLQVAFRLVGVQGGVNATRVLSGRAAEWEKADFYQALGQLSGVGDMLFVDDTAGLTVSQIAWRAKRLAARLADQGQRIGMLVVDYLQLVAAEQRREQRRIEVGAVSKGLKRLAKQLRCPLFALCQLSRAAALKPGEKPKRPTVATLYESDEIGQDADVVLLLHAMDADTLDDTDDARERSSDERQNRFIEGILAKQRNGPTGSVYWRFERATQRFVEVTREEAERRDTAAVGAGSDDPGWMP